MVGMVRDGDVQYEMCNMRCVLSDFVTRDDEQRWGEGEWSVQRENNHM